ncbi:MAG: SprT family zinc-dependent metalloprotease [Rubrivivax sp.]|nr:SprT family zinc-dependent metalloprotease [Rubrivivax sp.]
MPTRPTATPPEQLSLFDAEPPAVPLQEPLWVLPRPASTAQPGRPPAATPAATPVSSASPTRAAASTDTLEFRHPRTHRELLLSGHRVGYELRRSRRRSIGFVVAAEGLSVSAPRWVGQGEIESALREKAGWILRKLQEQRERAARLDAARVDWREGATIPFLGETVILLLDPRTTGAVLDTAADALPGVPRLTLHLGLPQTAEPEQIRDAVQSWLQRQARRIFEERCKLFAQRLGVRMTRLTLSSAATRWGSASADGSIRLNWRLVHFGLPVIDYVVTHELAHLREMNHGPAFWDVVRSALPDYEEARGALRHEVLPVLD